MNFTPEPWTIRNPIKKGDRPIIRCSDGLHPLALERGADELEANGLVMGLAPALFNKLLKLCQCIEADAAIHNAYNEAIEVLRAANGE